MIKTTIDKTKSIVILAMTFLLLIGPCSVRNNVEASLAIATTKPLNPSKSITAPANYCIVSENNSEKKGTQLSQKQIQRPHPLIVVDNFDRDSESKKTYYLQSKKGSYWTPAYYILYKRLKIFDLNEMNFA